MAQQIGRGAPITLDAFFTDGTGAAVDPVNPKVSILDVHGTVVVSLSTPTRVATGHWHYVYAVASDAELGAWAAQWFATINGAPVTDEDGFTVVEAGSIHTAQAGGITCAPWATHEDAPASLRTYDIDPNDVDDAFQAAGDILFELTGRRYPGVCSDVIRPQAQWRKIDDGVPRWWPATMQFGWGPAYGWCTCHRGRESGCNLVPEIKLPGHPVVRSSIVVKLDGVVFTDWELHDGHFLVRTDGEQWPCCQDMRLDDDSDGTFSIAYGFGLGPDIGGVKSCVALGTWLFADWHPDLAGKCSPPKRATTVTRTGTTVQLVTPTDMVTNGLTGINSVDLWVASKMFGQKRRRATVLIPGHARSARRVGR